MKKKIMMVMPVMKGGGAERVAAQLMNEFHRKGHDLRFLLTSCRADEVIRTDLNEEIPLTLLQEEVSQIKNGIGTTLSGKLSSAFCRIYEAMGKNVPARIAHWSFMTQYGREVQYLRNLMRAEPDLTVVSFLQPSVPMVVIAGRGLPNRIIFSERGNPQRLMKHRYGRNFIETYYDQISSAVFQTKDARNTYPKNVADKGVLIANPLKPDLPTPYEGERNKIITTYCRISSEKNLMMLVGAFSLLHHEYPDYQLKITGGVNNEAGRVVKQQLEHRVMELNMRESVFFESFSANVHEDILQDAMYVNCSLYEGMSNAMLESMAIGLPTICTDCPIGGARAVILDGENGLLVPVNDVQALYEAMKRIVDNEELAKKLSHNGAKMRNDLSLEQIAEKWLELI